MHKVCFTISLFHASFRAPRAHRQEVKNCIIQPLVSSHWNKWMV